MCRQHSGCVGVFQTVRDREHPLDPGDVGGGAEVGVGEREEAPAGKVEGRGDGSVGKPVYQAVVGAVGWF